MIPLSRQEHSHGKIQYIPGKQVLVRSRLWKIYLIRTKIFAHIGLGHFSSDPFDADKFSFGCWDQTGTSCCLSQRTRRQVNDPDYGNQVWILKFIYSEKSTKFCEIFTLLLTVCTVVKCKVKISQNFVAFSEYMNFTKKICQNRKCVKSMA